MCLNTLEDQALSGLPLLEFILHLNPPFQARVRYQQGLAPCEVRRLGDSLLVDFDEPAVHVAEHQIFAMYHGDICIGGAPISKRIDDYSPTEETQVIG